MRKALILPALFLCLSAGAAAQSRQLAPKAQAKIAAVTSSTATSPAALQAARDSFAKLPLSFEQNQGQTDSQVKYFSRGAGYNLFLTPEEAVFALRGQRPQADCSGVGAKAMPDCADTRKLRSEAAVLRLKMLGANASAQVSGSDPIPGRINYYIGNDPSKWRVGVRQFGRVTYHGIYPGVDLTYYGNQQQLESDFIVAPGASPRAIEFEVKGASSTHLNAQGNLMLVTSAGDVQVLRPGVYQLVNGVKRNISGKYVIRNEHRIGLEIGNYDQHSPLIIDPTFVYSTYLGGSNIFIGGDAGNSIAVDSTGAAYVTGTAGALDFPGAGTGPVAETAPAAFVTKFDPAGNSLMYSTLLRGTTGFNDIGYGIAVNGTNAYVTGITNDNDFPLLNPAQAVLGDDPIQSLFTQLQTGFVTGLASDGTLVYSTYWGGRNTSGFSADVTTLRGIAVDAAGDAYVVGDTTSQNFPTVNPLQATNNSTFQTAVTAEFNDQGQVVYSTYFGGNGSESGNAIAVDGAGNSYITGQTTSLLSSFPAPPASSPAPFQATNKGADDVFVAKFNFNSPSSTLSLAAATLIGGNNSDAAFGIAVDRANPPNVYLTGQTASTVTGTGFIPFPTQNALFGPNNIASIKPEAFVTELTGDFTALAFSTFLGGTGGDKGFAIAIDASTPPNVFVTGNTTSADFPVLNPLQIATITSGHVFVTEMTVNGASSALKYSTYIEGTGGEAGQGIAVDSTDNAYVTGSTTSGDFPVLSSTPPSKPFQDSLHSSLGNAFITKISPSAAPSGLNFNPSQFNYHEVGVGSFASEFFTLSNNSSGSITITAFPISGVNSGDFAVQPVGTTCTTTSSLVLTAGSSCILAVRFTPQLQDARSATVGIASTPASSSTIALTGFGAVPEVALSQTSVNFGTTNPLNVSTFNGVTITNTGGGILHVGSVQISSTVAGDATAFADTVNGCAAVQPHSSCNISLTFVPTIANHGYVGSLLINDDAVGSPQTLSMSGAGTPQVNLSPTSAEFGGWLVGTSSGTRGFSLQNGSGANLTLTSITAGGAFSADFPIDPSTSTLQPMCANGLVMLPGVTCAFAVHFAPGPTGGSGIDGRTASYTFAYTGAVSGSQVINLMGAGETGVTLYENSIPGPSDPLIQEYLGATLRGNRIDQLFNGTASPVTVTGITWSGANPGDFALELDNSCSVNGTVAANSVCYLDGAFTPSAAGTRTATATIHYTPPAGSILTLTVTATGLTGPVIFPGGLNMGSQIFGVTGSKQRVVYFNVGKLPVQISSVADPLGTNSADFSIVTDTCGTSTTGVLVPSGGKCFLDLQFKPGATGTRSASITVTDNGPGSPRTLNLTGTGEPGLDTISVTPNLLDFGNVVLVTSGTQPTLTATVYLTNGGAAATTITAAPVLTSAPQPFGLGGGSCILNAQVLPQGGTCTVVVTFKPNAVGLQSNSVTFTDSLGGMHTVSIHGTGVDQGALALSAVAPLTALPSTTSSPAQILTVTNSGNGPLTLSVLAVTGANGADFAIVAAPATVPPSTPCTEGLVIPPTTGNTCVIGIQFTGPKTVGTYTASALVTANLGNNVVSSLTTGLTGIVVSGGLSVTPAAPLNLGTVALGSNVTFSTVNGASVGLTNNNPGVVTITSLAPQTVGDFTVTDFGCVGASHPLQPAASCTFDVTFTPTVNAAETNNVVVNFTIGGGSPQTFLIAIKGTGSNALVATPNTANIIGSTSFSGSAFITITNGSTSPATITSLGAITGPNASYFSIGSEFCTGQTLLATGSFPNSCLITVTFKPLAAGTNLQAQFNVNYTVGTTPQSLQVNLIGTATAPQVSVVPAPPATLTFGNQPPNTQSIALSVTVTNTGTDFVFFNTYKITGPNANDFALAPQAFSFSGTGISGCLTGIQANQTCTIPITFTPSPLTPGTNRSATLTITDTAGTQTVLLAGNSTGGIVAVSPASVGFPDTNLGLGTTQSVLVTNSTNAAVAFNNVTFGTPSYSVDTTQTVNACSSSKPIIAFNGSCVVYIKFTPQLVGANPDTATIHTSNGTPTVTLSGNGKSSTVSVSPTAVTFTTAQLVGTQSAPIPVTLTNGTLASITISGTPTITGDFLLGANSCTGTVTSGSNCTVNVIFKPTGIGTRNGTLHIADSGSPSSFSIPLSGNGAGPDLSITKAHAGTFSVGAQGNYTITVANVGGIASSGTVTVSDALPAALTFVAAGSGGNGWTCVVGPPVSCTSSAAIAPSSNSSFTLVVNVLPAAAPSVTNTATVSDAGDVNPAGTDKSSSDIASVSSIDLQVTKSHSGNFTIGGNGVYTIAVKNVGNSATTGTITVTDALPAGLSFVSATGTNWTCGAAAGTVTCTNQGPLSAGTSAGNITLTVGVAAAAAPSVSNTATVSDPGDTISAGADKSSSDVATVNSIDLQVTKSHTGNFPVGTNGVYTIAVKNAGNTASTGTITVTDVLPTGLTFVSGTGTGWLCNAVGQTVTCTNAAPLAGGASSNITLTVGVAAAAAPSVTNTVTVADPGDSNLTDANKTSSDVTNVTTIDLQVTKSHAGNFTIGTNGTYTIAVKNLGNSATTGTITVTDTLPAGLGFVAAGSGGSGSGWNCSATGQVVTCTNAGPLATGATSSFPLVVTVAAAAAPSATNKATVSDPGDTNAAGVDKSSSDLTTVNSIDLKVVKSHVGSFTAGSNGTYTIAVSNAGNTATTGAITVTDSLPAGLSFVSGTGTGWLCNAAGQTVTCTNAAPVAGGSAAGNITLVVGVSAAAAPSVTNTATVADAGDSSPAGVEKTSSDLTNVATIDLQAVKSHSGNFTIGGNGVYTIAVKNVGNSATTGTITVTDALPAGLSFVSAAGTNWTCSAAAGTVTCTTPGPLAAGASAGNMTLTVGVAAAAAPSVSNTATVSDPGDTNSAGADKSSSDVATVNSIDLQVTKSHTGNFPVGTNGVYTIAVKNAGNTASTGTITVTDVLPTGLTFVSGTGTGWTCGATAGTVTCTNPGPLAGGASSNITLTVGVAAAAAPSVTNTATVADPGDSNPTDANKTSSDVTNVTTIDLQVTKSHTGNFTIGTNGTYTIAVKNLGNSATTGTITVTDTLPAGLGFVAAGSGGSGWNCSATGQVVTCTNAGALATGATSSFPLVVTVAAAAAPSVTNKATVADPGDTNAAGADKSSSDLTTVIAASLSLQKSHLADFVVGQPGTYTLQVSNGGTAPTSGTTTVTDTLPAGLTFTSFTGVGWNCLANGQTVTCTSTAAIAPSGSSSFTITVAVAQMAHTNSPVTNSATVSNPNDTGTTGKTATDPTNVTAPDLTIASTHPGNFTVGVNGTYTLKVTNNGNGPATTVTVTDTLPSGLGFSSGVGAGWTCSAAAQVVTCTNPGPIAAGATSSITLTATVSNSAVPTITNSVVVADPGDTTNGDKSATDITTVNAAPTPDLSITKTHIGSFTVGTPGQYSIQVTNQGTLQTSGTITVVDTLPVGLSFASFNGAGWNCSAVSQVVTCTNSTVIPVSGSSGFTITVNVLAAAATTSATPNTVTNTATVSDPGDGNASGTDKTSANPTAVTAPHLTVAKSHTAAFTVGSNGSYTITVTNSGSAPTTGVITVSDTLPAGLVFVPAGSGGNGWTCVAGSPVSCTNAGPLANGSNSSFTLNVSVSAAAAAASPITNNVIVTTVNDPAPGATGSDVNTVAAPHLTIAKSHAGNFSVGANGTYTITVTNAGTVPTNGTITVTDTLPAGLTFLSAGSGGNGWTCTAGTPVNCTNPGPIANGANSSFPIVVSVAVAAANASPVTNSASVTTPNDSNPGLTANDPTTVVNPDLSISKSHVGNFVSGGNGTYSIKITNNGVTPTGAVITVTDTLPVGLTFVSGVGAGWTCSAGSQNAQVVTCTNPGPINIGSANASTITLTASVGKAAATASPVTNSVTVSDPGDNDPAGKSATDPTIVNAPDLAITKTHSGSFEVGLNGVYTIKLTNNGSAATQQQITVTDTLPTGLTFVSGTGTGWTCGANAQIVTCTNAGPINTGAVNASTITLTVMPTLASFANSPVMNSATVADAGDIGTNDKSVTDPVPTVITAPDVTISKSHIGDFTVGANGIYTIKATNNGTGPTVGNIVVTDTLATGFALVPSANAGSGWACTGVGQIVTCTYSGAALAAAGGSCTLTLTVSVGPNAITSSSAQGFIAMNSATVSDPNDSKTTDKSATDPNPTNIDNAAPTQSAFTPALGLIAGATTPQTITLTGTGFNSSTQVTVGTNTPLTGTANAAGTSLTISVPTSYLAAGNAGNLTVGVSNPKNPVTFPTVMLTATTTQMFPLVGIAIMPHAGTPSTLPIVAGTPFSLMVDVPTTPTAGTKLPADVNITCSFPASLTGATCSANPATITAGTTSGTSAIMINAVPTKAAALPSSRPQGQGSWPTYLLWVVAAALISMLGMAAAGRQKMFQLGRAPAYLTLVLLVLAAGALVGCTTNGSNGPTPTPTGASTVTVTATTADGATASTVVNINVTN